MQHRVLFFASLVSVAAGVLVFACADDSPIVVVNGPDTGTPDGSPPANQADGSVPTEDGATADAKVDDAANDADPIERDAGGVVDASGCTSCDCDRDGFQHQGQGCTTGPFDCDDNDTRYKPGQRFLEVKPDPGKTADFDCVRGIEKLYPTGVSCGALSCPNGAEGFTADPPCGEQGVFVVCGPGALGICTETSRATKTQACH